MFYSKTTNSFYTEEIHGNSMPDDVVEITTEQHAELFEGQSQGKQIIGDSEGFPVLIDRVVVMTYAEKRKNEYPSLEDQFDTLYHGGYDAWKNTIRQVKDKYPKE